jgi:hypothetical protein
MLHCEQFHVYTSLQIDPGSKWFPDLFLFSGLGAAGITNNSGVMYEAA